VAQQDEIEALAEVAVAKIHMPYIQPSCLRPTNLRRIDFGSRSFPSKLGGSGNVNAFGTSHVQKSPPVCPPA
jgi:hypothetical protein